jgi:hypothetical protein
MADAAASKAAVRKGVRVRVPLRARPSSCIRAGQAQCEASPNETKSSQWSQVGHKEIVSTLIAVCTLLGGVVSVFAILAWFTERGRQVRLRFAGLIRRRPLPPRTHVHIEPDSRLCIWSQAPASNGRPRSPVRRSEHRPAVGPTGAGSKVVLGLAALLRLEHSDRPRIEVDRPAPVVCLGPPREHASTIWRPRRPHDEELQTDLDPRSVEVDGPPQPARLASTHPRHGGDAAHGSARLVNRLVRSKRIGCSQRVTGVQVLRARDTRFGRSVHRDHEKELRRGQQGNLASALSATSGDKRTHALS